MRFMRIENGIVESISVWRSGVEAEAAGLIPAIPGVGIGWADSGGGVFTPPARPSRFLPPRQIRDRALRQVSHTFSDGKEISVSPAETPRIRDAIEIMEKRDIESTRWIVLDGSRRVITVAELREALEEGQAQSLAIWDAYDPEV